MGVKVREKVKGSGVWWIFIDHKGRRKAIKVGSEKAAIKSAAKIEQGLSEGKVKLRPRGNVLFRDQYEKWIGQHVGMSCEVSTVETYKSSWENNVKEHFGHLSLDSIDRERIREFYRVKKEEGKAKATIKNMKSVISGVIELAIEDKLLEVNPTLRSGKYLKDAKAKRKSEFLTREESRLLLDGVKMKYRGFYPFFLTALRTGLRQGELIGLKWEDIDWNGKFLMVRRTAYHKGVKVPKNGKTRKVDLSDQLLLALRDHKRAVTAHALKRGRGVAEFVFTTHLGTLLDASWVRKVFTDSLKAVGMRVVPFHALRHSFASALIGNGASLTYVRDQMGHSSIQITVDTYGHLVPGANRAEVNKLDDPGYGLESATQAQPAVIGLHSGAINQGYSESPQSSWT